MKVRQDFPGHFQLLLKLLHLEAIFYASLYLSVV